MGRSALRSVLALDEAGRGAGRAAFADETDGIVTARNLLPTWSVRLIVLCLLLPALLAALDAYFRARRHRLERRRLGRLGARRRAGRPGRMGVAADPRHHAARCRRRAGRSCPPTCR